MEFVALFTVILFIVAMAKIMKSYELAEGLKANDEDVIPDSESKNNATMMLIFGILFIGSVFYQMKILGGLTLPEAASEHGVVYDSLMNVTMTLIYVTLLHIIIFNKLVSCGDIQVPLAIFSNHPSKQRI